MRYPDFLRNNGTIAFIAPSYGCTLEPNKTVFENALINIEKLGLRTIVGANCYKDCGIGKSNTPEKCGEELNDFYLREDNDVIISCGGGELMCEDLDFIDFARIIDGKAKWYMGYSDNTNFTFLLTTICDTASVYGTNVSAFGMEPWYQSVQDSLDMLMGRKMTISGYDRWEKTSLKSIDTPFAPYNLTEKKQLVIYNPKNVLFKNAASEFTEATESKDITMSGRIVGGCMDCLTTLIGTCFDRVDQFAEKYKNDGIIWFLEACDMNTMDIRRSLWQMQHAGWFKYIKGFLFGRPLCHGTESFGLNQYDAVTGILDRYDVPIVMDADIGHLPPAMPVMCGAYARITADYSNISITYDMK